MSPKGTKGTNDSFVSRLVKDPSRPPETVLLNGFPGDSSEKGHSRLYLDAELSNWVDLPEDLILHTEDVQDASGLPAALVWIRREAMDKLRFRTPIHGHFPPPPLTLSGPACPPTPWAPFCPPTVGGFHCLPTRFPPMCPPTRFPPLCPPTRFPPMCPPTVVGPFCPLTVGGPYCPPTATGVRCPPTPGCPWPPGGGTLTTAICPSVVDACPSAPAGCEWITPYIQTPQVQTPQWGGGAFGAGGFGAGGFGAGGFGAGGFGFGQ